MTAAVGLPTLRLVRVAVGPYTLDGLAQCFRGVDKQRRMIDAPLTWAWAGGMRRERSGIAAQRIAEAHRFRSNSETSRATMGLTLSIISWGPKRASIRPMPLESAGPSAMLA